MILSDIKQDFLSNYSLEIFFTNSGIQKGLANKMKLFFFSSYKARKGI